MANQDDDEPITLSWLRSIGGKVNNSRVGNMYADFEYDRITLFRDGVWPMEPSGEFTEIWLRVHEPHHTDDGCMVDLFIQYPKDNSPTGIGLTRRWPKTRGDLRRLFDGLRMNEPSDSGQ